MKALLVQVPMEVDPQIKTWGHAFVLRGSPGTYWQRLGKRHKEVEVASIGDILQESPLGVHRTQFSWRTTKVSLDHLAQSYPLREGCMRSSGGHEQTPLGHSFCRASSCFSSGENGPCTLGGQVTMHCNHNFGAQGHEWGSPVAFILKSFTDQSSYVKLNCQNHSLKISQCGPKPLTDTSLKEIFTWQLSIRKDVPHQSSSGEWNIKPPWDTTAHLSEWPKPNNDNTKSARDAEKH